MIGPLGLYGGSFDPPHRGHVELARRAKEELGLGPLLVLVSSAPGHKHVDTPADVRLRLAQAAFPDDEVVLDEFPRTIDLLRAHPEWSDPVFLIGADQFRSFLAWKEPDEVLRYARLAVATRPGFPHEELEPVLSQLAHPERVLFFEIDPTPVASRELRERLAGGEEAGPEVPSAVGDLIRSEGLYLSLDD
ncbi:MAG TPA: nicotinate-nicotinamide nucleotide adenylyltransferase [Gaiellaceae bacterium]